KYVQDFAENLRLGPSLFSERLTTRFTVNVCCGMRINNPFFSTLGTLDGNKIAMWVWNHYISFRHHYYHYHLPMAVFPVCAFACLPSLSVFDKFYRYIVM